LKRYEEEQHNDQAIQEAEQSSEAQLSMSNAEDDSTAMVVIEEDV